MKREKSYSPDHGNFSGEEPISKTALRRSAYYRISLMNP